MADSNGETKISYPYLSANQWYGIRGKLKQSLPRVIDIDWLIGKLDTTQKTARNVLPQLRTMGLVNAENSVSDLADDLRHDETYATACRSIVEAIYPESLRNAHSDPDEDLEKVAGWFSRNARTGDIMSKNQAKTYLLLLGGKLPTGEETAPVPKRRSKNGGVPVKSQSKSKQNAVGNPGVSAATARPVVPVDPSVPPISSGGHPTLHVDMQIHISADAGDSQIEAIFKSMAKHLYGRE